MATLVSKIMNLITLVKYEAPFGICASSHDKWMNEWMLITQSCPTLCNPMNCSPAVSSVLGIHQARILGWVAIPFFRGSSQTRVSCVTGRFFTVSATREAKLSILQANFMFLVTANWCHSQWLHWYLKRGMGCAWREITRWLGIRGNV